MKLFFGEYEPAHRELSIGNARVAFLNAVRRHIPEVLEELNGQPFECYKNIGAPFAQWWEIKHGRVGRESSLRASLFRWSKTWRLEPEWCLDHALRTLWEWHAFPSQREKLMWQQGGGWMVPTNEEERRFTFEHPGWEPTHDFRKSIKREIQEAFNRQLEEYLDRMESLVKERGYVKTKQKNEPEHFEWLACFQVKGMNYAEIRDSFKPQAGP
ncbi:MAG: hypothetical protein M3416_16885 [Acidobacteriota bacterium]|nr:hypothetical protein [Acidobacteriota bacterium]